MAGKLLKSMRESETQLTEERIDQFKEEIGAKLPRQYREFLLQFYPVASDFDGFLRKLREL